MAKKKRTAKRLTKAAKRRPSTKRKSRRKDTTVRLTGVAAKGKAGSVGTLSVGAATVAATGNTAGARTAIQTVSSRHEPNAALQATRGVVEPPPTVVKTAALGERIDLSVRADAIVIPAPIPIKPTVYPDNPQETVIVQNFYGTINVGSVDFKNFNTTIDALVKQLQFGRSNAISGEVCAQLLSEITAGREILKGPKPIRELVDLLLLRPLKYLAEKAAGAIIGTLAGQALELLLKMIM
jgi:hypothetical protein